MATHPIHRLIVTLLIVLAFAMMASACGGDDDGSPASTTVLSGDAVVPPVDPFAAAGQRLDEIAAAVADWSDATTIEDAHTAAEAARNLVVGPAGPGYGDTDGDGTVAGETDTGLLPSSDGVDPGLALIAVEAGAPECVLDDVLGGPWEDPGARWDTMADAIAAWTPSGNTMPSLPSHPQRIVGWATFTLESGDLAEAHEFAGHADLHVGVSRNAFDC